MPKIFTIEPVNFNMQAELLKAKRMRAMILNGQKEVAKWVRKDLYKTVQFWKHNVEFAYIIHYARGNIYLEIGPVASVRGARIWQYVNDGTSMIPFVFNPKYVQKTQYPGSIGTNTPGAFTRPSQKILRDASGNPIQGFTPGIRARGWTVLLQAEYAPILADAMRFAIARGLGEI